MTSTISRSTRTRPQHPAPSRPRRGLLSVPALVAATAGTALVMVAMLALDWYQIVVAPLGNLTRSWGALDLIGQVVPVPELVQAGVLPSGTFPGAFPAAYFGWIAWVLLGAAVIATVLGATRVAHRVKYAVGGAVLAVAGFGVTIAATIAGAVTLANTMHQPLSVDGFFTATQAGAWVAAAGFLVLAIAAITAAVSGRRANKTAQPA